MKRGKRTMRICHVKCSDESNRFIHSLFLTTTGILGSSTMTGIYPQALSGSKKLMREV
jgi:hypothetical protein